METEQVMSTDSRHGQAVPRLLLTPRQAAKALSISEKTLYNYTKSADIPVVRIGRAVRYDMADLRAWIEQSKKSSENS